MTEEQRRKYLHDENGDTRTNDEIYRLIQIDGLQAQLSSKSQECRDLEEGAKQWKATAEWYQKENELLHKQYTELCNRNSDSDSTQDQPSEYKKSLIQQIMDLQKRCEDLEDENEKLEQYINEMTSNM